jgi:hypothetical protein
LIDVTAGAIECYCQFGEINRDTYYARLSFEAPEGERFFRLANDPDLDIGFDPNETLSLDGTTIDQPTMSDGDEVEFSMVDPNDLSLARISGRTYRRITQAEFEALIAGEINMPAPNDFAGIELGDEAPPVADERFFGIKLDGEERICFICDGSGSMGDHFPRLQAELIQLISALSNRTKYIVVYFSGKTIGDLKWRPAGRNGARALARRLTSMESGGGSDPIPAFEIALGGRSLRDKPNTIFLLTDGQLEGSVKNVLDRLNRKGTPNRVRIHTIGFGDDQKGHRTLEDIAAGHGGEFRAIQP